MLEFNNIKCEKCNETMTYTSFESFTNTCIEEFICEKCGHVQIFDCDDFYND